MRLEFLITLLALGYLLSGCSAGKGLQVGAPNSTSPALHEILRAQLDLANNTPSVFTGVLINPIPPPEDCITVVNNGTQLASNLNRSITSGAFSLLSNSVNCQDPCGTTLAVGASCSFALSFDPSAAISYSATFQVNYYDGTQNTSSRLDMTFVALLTLPSPSPSPSPSPTISPSPSPIVVISPSPSPSASPVASPSPSPVAVAKWIATDNQDCANVCGGLKKINVVSVEGMKCASGENRPAISGAGIKYIHGTFGSIDSVDDAVSVGGNCYKSGQKKDGDGTDKTVACYCQ